MSSTSSPSQPILQRPSRFLEGEPLTQSPISAMSPFLASILSEQDWHDTVRRSGSRSRQGSGSSVNSTHPHPPTSAETSPTKQPIKSTRPVESMDWTTRLTVSSPSHRVVTARKSLEETRPKERTSEKIVGRIRAWTSGQSNLERKIQRGEVVPYPGT